jgi:phage antirepressor YoqD-like protein
MHTISTPINSRADSSALHQAPNLTRQVMSSREIAELTDKRHDNVKRDILAMLKDLKVDVLSFEDIYLDGRNRQQVQYLLDREHTDCLLTGYSAGLRMKVIRRWHELEGRVIGKFQIPASFAEALRLAAAQAEENQQLLQVIERQAPKVAAIRRLAGACGAICITDAAKQLQIRPAQLFDWLQQNRWIYRRGGSTRWIAMEPRIQSGLLVHKVTSLRPDHETGVERAAFQPLVTPKGLAVLAEKNIGAAL